MPAFIVKADPDEDFYVRWSTIVDAPTNWGRREDFQDPAERFERADRNGTSALWDGLPDEGQPGGWNHETFIVREVVPELPEGHGWELPRKNLKSFCMRLDRGEDPSDLMTTYRYE